jgi:hypothetical protein
MAEIKSIHGGRVPGEPSEGVVEDLEKLLAEAKEGTLIAFAYASVRDCGEPTNPVCGTGWAGAGGTKYPLGATIAMLNQRYVGALLGDSD